MESSCSTKAPRSAPTIGTVSRPAWVMASTTWESMPDVQMPSVSSYWPEAIQSLINWVVVAGSDVGRYATVGAGTVVTKPVVDHGLVVGNPGRRIGWVCACGHRLPEGTDGTSTCGRCGRSYRTTESGLEATA